MSSRFAFLSILAALTLAALGCSLFTGIAPSSEAGGPPPGILFQDDFADPSSGWDQVNNPEGITNYENGYYRILVNTTDTDVWANPGLHFTDVIIEVEATKAGGPDDNDFGVICRYKDIDNFYMFIISSDGYYGVGKVKNGELTLVGTDQLQPHKVIRQGAATNQIRADCIGSHLVLQVNGTTLADVVDGEFTSGDVGLVAGTYSESGTDIHFDNFIVRRP